MSARENIKLKPPCFRNSHNILRHLLRFSLVSHIDIRSTGSFQCKIRTETGRGWAHLKEVAFFLPNCCLENNPELISVPYRGKPQDGIQTSWLESPKSVWLKCGKQRRVLFWSCMFYVFYSGFQWGISIWKPHEVPSGWDIQSWPSYDWWECGFVLRGRLPAERKDDAFFWSLFRRLRFRMPCYRKPCSFLMSFSPWWIFIFFICLVEWFHWEGLKPSVSYLT